MIHEIAIAAIAVAGIGSSWVIVSAIREGKKARGDSDSLYCPEGAWQEPKGHDFSYPVGVACPPEAIGVYTPRWLADHGLTLDTPLSEATPSKMLERTLKPQEPQWKRNFAISKEARSAAVARGNHTRAVRARVKSELEEVK